MRMELENKKDELTPVQTLRDRVIEHRVLSYFYDENPKTTIINICSYSLQSDSRLEFSRQKANKVFNSMHFSHLYPDSTTDWPDYFKNTFYKMQNTYKPAKEGERISNFIVAKDVLKIPKNLWVIPSKNQKLKQEEFQFILKTLNYKILKNFHTKGRDFYTLPQNWFLNDFAKKNFYDKTKRRINRHKISRITELLSEHDLIVKHQPWDQKTNKIKPIIYKLGDGNFYKRRILAGQ